MTYNDDSENNEFAPYYHIYLWLENGEAEGIEFIKDFKWEDA